MIYTTENPSSYILFEVEIVLLSLSFITATIFGIVLWQTKTFHRNIRVLFMSLIIATYGYAFSRFYLIANDFSKDFLNQDLPTLTSVFVFTETLFGIMFTINQLGVVTERIMATIYSNSYEKHGYFSTFMVFIVPWLFNVITRSLNYVNFINIIFLSFVLLGCNIVTWTCLIVLNFVNRKTYKNGIATNLSKKYQIAENIRVVRVLIVFVIITAIRNSINITFLLIIGYYSKPNQLDRLTILLYHSLRLVLSFYILLYPFPLIFSHKDLKKKFIGMILRIKRKTSLENKNLKNALGEQILMNHTGEEYFQALEQNWSKKTKQGTKKPQKSIVKPSNRVSNSVV